MCKSSTSDKTTQVKHATRLHTSTRIPVDDSYVALVGKAVYVFSYYEWTIIYLIQHLRPSEQYVQLYCRGDVSHTSGKVLQKFRNAHENPEHRLPRYLKNGLKQCAEEFKALIDERNALVHAHPTTDVNGEQILCYQSSTTKPIPDMKWTKTDVESFIGKVDVKFQKAKTCYEAVKAIQSGQ